MTGRQSPASPQWLSVAAALFVIAQAPAYAQAADIPRTPEGRPDFQGIWENRWLTPFERPDGTTMATLSGDEATAFAKKVWDKFFEGDGALHPEGDFDFAGLMPAGDGTFRTSLIVAPASGKRPDSQLSKDLAPVRRTMRKAAENPEGLSNDERCLSANGRVPLGISAGGMYRQIVQTPDNMMIHTEDQMVTRIIGIGAAPRPAALLSLGGDSVASWEGDTLVVLTDKIRPQLTPPGSPPYTQDRRVTERFSLTGPDQLSYEYVLEDSAMQTEPMHVQYMMSRTEHTMFESACHEGNYSIGGMMLGARLAEQAAAAKPASSGKSRKGKKPKTRK